jgi:hypothetical protein
MAASAEGPDRQHGLQFSMFAAPSTGAVRWRLLGGNNRDLGRGCLDYPDAATCLAGLRATLTDLALLEPAMLRAEHGRWVWRLRKAGEDVVVSGHPFDRKLRCVEACDRFLRLSPSAEIHDDAVVMSRGGHAFRPRSYVAVDLTVGPRSPRVNADSALGPPRWAGLPTGRSSQGSAAALEEEVR